MFRFVVPPVPALLGSMFVLDRMLPSLQAVKPPLTWARCLGVLEAAAIAMRHARLFHTIGINIQTFGEPSGLYERVVFSRSLNPMYLGMLTLLLGAAWIGSLVAFAGLALFFATALLWYIPYKEDQMRQKYGDRYQVYYLRWLALGRREAVQ